MAQPSQSNGVPPKVSKPKKQQQQQDERTEKLRKVEEAADNGKMPRPVVDSLNEQASLSKGKPAVDPHSKPPFEVPDGQSVLDNASGNGAVEPHDMSMGEATNNDGSQPAAADFGRNSSGDLVDTPMAETINEDTSEPPVNAMPGSVGGNANEEDGMLVSFQKMSIGGSQFGGQPEAWFSTGSSTKAIVRHGPLKGAMYKIQSAKGYNLRNLPEASDKNSRITQIWDRDENGRRHRRYTVENIEGIVGIVILEHANPDHEYLKAPRAYLKIKCINIANEDQKLLLPGGCAWVPKADLDGLFEAEVITRAITIAWDKQEARWLAYEEGAGRSSPDRLPSVCPLDAFIREKRSLTHSASPRSSAKSRSPKSKFRRSPSSIIIDSIETDAQGTSPFKRPVEVRQEEVSYPNLSVERESPEPYIKQEQKEGDPELFVQQPSAPAATAHQSNVVDIESASAQREKREPLKFNVDSYLAQLRRTEKWNTMSENEQAKRAAKALANYDHYKEERLRMGDIEEKEEEEEEEEL